MNTANNAMVDEIAGVLADEGDAAHEMQQAMEEYEEQEEPLTEDEVLSIITAEMSQTSTGSGASEIDTNREEALKYYLGNPRGDEHDGSSQVISTDVADAIEWILPQIIKSLISKGSVISFDAISEGDEMQAELETDFTHDQFMKENPGFLNLYEFVKDALMQKNGIFKIYYEDVDEVTTETYDGLSQQELEMLGAQENVEMVEVDQEIDQAALQQRQQQIQQAEMQLRQMSQNPQMMQQVQQGLQMLEQVKQEPPPMRYSVRVRVTETHGKIRVDCIPPEEFRINKFHNSLRVEEARFCAHVTEKTRSDLISEGYDPEIINNTSDNLTNTYEKEFRFAEQDESVSSDPNYSEDESQQLLEVSECYIMMDVNKTGIAELVKVTVLGSEDATDILDIEPVDSNPFVSSSAIIMSHKFHGLSVYDRLKQLQDQKTSLWRNIMDNLYLQNNREKEVVEGQVNIDDLLVSRPGGIKRVKAPGMIRELQVQPIGQEGFQMLDYLDTIRTGRVGVSPDTAGQSMPVGNDTAHGIERLMTAKEELTGLMVRVIAETGLKEAYLKVRDLMIRYKDNETAYKFKGQWVDVNPAQWGKRSRTTVNVGTGTGDDMRKQAAIQQVLMYQEKLLADPTQTLVDDPQIFEALDEFTRVAGLTGAAPYFLDPNSQEGSQKKEQGDQQRSQEKQKMDQLQQMMADAQVKLGEAEQMKGQAALQSQQAKLQVEQSKAALTASKQQSENEKAAIELTLEHTKTELQAFKDGAKQEYDYAKLEQEEALKLTEMEVKHQEELSRQHAENLRGAQDNATNSE